MKYVATVGFFDGVHAGHQFLIEELKTLSLTEKLKSMVITFNTHPRKVLNADFETKLLTSLPEKLDLLQTTRVDRVEVLDFTPELAQMSAYNFLKTILKEKYKVSTLLIGHDHRFGYNRTEGFEEYQKYGEILGMEVIQAERYKTSTDNHISSSQIRQALIEGNIEQANRLLGYPYTLQAEVVAGFQLGRTIGFPTANLQPETDKLIPSHGVYAVKVYVKDKKYNGMMNIGTRPTISEEDKVSFEVNILDFDQNIYGQTIKVEFLAKIRDEKKFNGLDELIEQLNKDKERVSSFFA